MNYAGRSQKRDCHSALYQSNAFVSIKLRKADFSPGSRLKIGFLRFSRKTQGTLRLTLLRESSIEMAITDNLLHPKSLYNPPRLKFVYIKVATRLYCKLYSMLPSNPSTISLSLHPTPSSRCINLITIEISVCFEIRLLWPSRFSEALLAAPLN